MKSFIVFALFVAAAVALPTSSSTDEKAAVIVKSLFENIGVNGYGYESETSNGIRQQEQGQLKNVGTENEAIEVRGQFSYVGPDGVTYAVEYIANELGFQPRGAHFPVGPSA